MPEVETQVKTNKGKNCYLIGSIIGVILIILILSGYFGLAWIMRKIDPKSSTETTLTENVSNPQIIGTWASDCLIPDPESKWAEKHQMVIDKNTIVHTRWENSSGTQDCNNPTDTKITNYTYSIPTSGQINLTAEDNNSIFDIYLVEGDNLYFGHGFRGDNMAYSANFGGSEAQRIENLNRYIIYKKK